MEYVSGKDLDDRYISQGIRDESTIYKVIISLAEALAFCHSMNIIHRDLKVGGLII